MTDHLYKKSLVKDDIDKPMSLTQPVVKQLVQGLLDRHPFPVDQNKKGCSEPPMKARLSSPAPVAAAAKVAKKLNQFVSQMHPIPEPVSEVEESLATIDPEDDSGLDAYGAEIIHYSRMRERKLQVPAESWMLKDERYMSSRALLTGWMMEVLHRFQTGPPTLYYSISLLDRYMHGNKPYYPKLQLVGVACIFIATKLEEYNPADLNELCFLTKKSCKPSNILKMEKLILASLDFAAYGEDPFLFLNRCIRAANRHDDALFLEVCCFLLDTTVTDMRAWQAPSSKRAAAAVFAALHLGMTPGHHQPWTLNLAYFSGYQAAELAKLATQMLRNMAVVCGGDDPDVLRSVKIKYHSRSQHLGLLQRPDMNSTVARRAIEEIKRTLF